MSSEEFTSIEENGNYWLSKTNTAYHIINPNASNLTTIEANGYYSLARGGDTYYILDASGNSIKLNLNGRTFFNDFTGVVSQTGSTNTYTPTNVEENPFDGGFLVLASRNDVTPNWDNSSWFNYNNFGFEFNTLGKYTGSDIKIVNNYAMPRPGIEYESLFELDLDNNGVITPRESPTNLLDISGNQHHLDDGHGGDSIILKRDNVIIDPNSNGGLNATQVQKNGDHYELLLVHENVKYDVWKFDASGNFVSSIKAKLWEDELKFGIDINGDGDTGLVEIEDNGDVHLKHGDNTYNGAAQYYIINENDDPIGLTYAGWAIRSDSSNGWNVTQVEESGDGYQIFWSGPDGKYSVWNVDALGSIQSQVTAPLWQHEITFEHDLNGDLSKGLVTIEDNGNINLAHGDNQYIGDAKYYIVKGNDNPISLTQGGVAKSYASSNAWKFTQVEESGDGYQILLSGPDGKYSVWNVDALGSIQSQVTAKLWQHEITFEYDLNGDGLDSGDNNIWDRHGIDYFDGGAGDDIINGFSGHDTLIGGEGNDRLTGDGGSGFAGNDILFGNAGNDWLRGRAGDDELYGGDGDDILIGDLGSDTITTGSGSDRIILSARDLTDPSGELSEADTITDFTDVSDLLSVTQGDVDIHYSQLTIAQGSGSNSNDTIIKYGSEYLAILKNIDVYLLSEDDFTPAGIALDIA
jgi:hypothetical protein